MNVVVWIIAGLLALAFLAAGLVKLTQPKDKLVQKMAWAENVSPGQIKAIGLVEVLGAIGLFLPAALGIAPILTPLAAVGLTITMVLAALVHLRRQETPIPPIVLGVGAAFVAVMTFGASSL